MTKNERKTLNFALIISERTIQLHEEGNNLEKIKQEIIRLVAPNHNPQEGK